MRRIRVLIVESSTSVRRLLVESLGGDPAIELAGTAATLQIALAKIPRVRPDLVTLDPDLSDSQSVGSLSALRSAHPQLPVIVFSGPTQQRGPVIMREWTFGATEFVLRPSNGNDDAAIAECIRWELLPKIKFLCGIADTMLHETPLRRVGDRQPTRPHRQPLEIVAIGASTGGPDALASIFRHIPVDFPLPIVVVQHMPPIFTTYLAERLHSLSPLDVREAKDGDVIERGCAWIAPGDFHMTLARSAGEVKVHLHQGPRVRSCRPAADVLFRSVAETYGPHALAVVLTGMGNDGLDGCRMIRAAGGWVIAQDQATSIVWGMPGAVAAAGLADQVLQLQGIAAELSQLTTKCDQAKTTPNALIQR